MRIGLHIGEAIRHGDDFFGRSVVMAARIAGRADGGESLLSALVRELTTGREDIVTRSAGTVELNGLDERHELFSVAWEAGDTTPVVTDESPAAENRRIDE